MKYYYFIINKEKSKCCYIDKEKNNIDYTHVSKDFQLTELENLPNNVLVNPKLYLGNEYFIYDNIFIKYHVYDKDSLILTKLNFSLNNI